MKIKTNVLDRAAFYMTYGCEVKVYGRYPNNYFEIDSPHFLFLIEAFSLVPYRRFTNKRRVIKRISRKMAGLPEHFTGDKDIKFRFSDLAIVKDVRGFLKTHKKNV